METRVAIHSNLPAARAAEALLSAGDRPTVANRLGWSWTPRALFVTTIDGSRVAVSVRGKSASTAFGPAWHSWQPTFRGELVATADGGADLVGAIDLPTTAGFFALWNAMVALFFVLGLIAAGPAFLADPSLEKLIPIATPLGMLLFARWLRKYGESLGDADAANLVRFLEHALDGHAVRARN